MIEDHGQIYRDAFSRHGASPKALHWWDYRSMAIRFKQLVADLDLKGKTILDAGCGMGDLLPFLYSKADHFNYLGVDVNEDFIKIARQRYEGHRFEVADPFFGKFRGRFDIVISSGVMNAYVPRWMKEREEMITKLYKLAGEAVAFNMAGGFGKPHGEGVIAYADTQEVLDFCQSLASRVILRDHYDKEDFTVILFK